MKIAKITTLKSVFLLCTITRSWGLRCRQCGTGGLCSSSSDNGAEKECDSGYNACIFSEASKLYFDRIQITFWSKVIFRLCWSGTSSTRLWFFTQWARWMSNSRSGWSWSRILLLHSRQLQPGQSVFMFLLGYNEMPTLRKLRIRIQVWKSRWPRRIQRMSGSWHGLLLS